MFSEFARSCSHPGYHCSHFSLDDIPTLQDVPREHGTERINISSRPRSCEPSVLFDVAHASQFSQYSTKLPAVKSVGHHDEEVVNSCVELFDQLEHYSDHQLHPSLNSFIESYQALPLMARARVENWFIDLDEL